jgi:hypothetical protein
MSLPPSRQAGCFSTLFEWAFGPRNPMKNPTPDLWRGPGSAGGLCHRFFKCSVKSRQFSR